MKLSLRQGLCGLAAAVILGSLALRLHAGILDSDQRPQAAATPAWKPDTGRRTLQDSADRMSALVKELSGEKYEGRLPGTIGDALSLEFIVNQFQSLGLQAAGDSGDGYLQRFETTISEPNGIDDDNPANPHLKRRMASSNVIGILPGNDPELSKEVIIISAHRDHLGCTPDGQQYPGANDDLSGLASLMELARKFAQHKGENKRTLMFVAYGAEEQKEMGSMHHVATLLPNDALENVVLMISIDMIGLGYEAWSDFSETKRKGYADRWYADVYNGSKTDADEYSHEYPPTNSDTFSYDAGPFAKYGVNNRVFGKTENIPHYHKPSDTWATLEFEPAAIVTHTIFDFLWKVSQKETPQPPTARRAAVAPKVQAVRQQAGKALPSACPVRQAPAAL